MTVESAMLSGAEMWDLKDKERRKTRNKAGGVPQISNFTNVITLGDLFIVKDIFA
jgi:hypothetical protein